MFGFSFSELVVVVLVAIVVMGPKDLPKMLRRVGQWAGKIRRTAADLRASSGIDEALRSEGLADDIAEIRKLARGELDGVRAATLSQDGVQASPQDSYGRSDDFYVVRDREYPREGADAYGALPENAVVYAEGLPKSVLHRDALYVMGDENAVLPEPEPPAPLAVGPTLAGVGATDADAVDMDGNPLRAPDAVHDAVTATPGEVGPTLHGIGPKNDVASPKNDDNKSEEITSEPSHSEAL